MVLTSVVRHEDTMMATLFEPPTSLIGRESEIALARQLLSTTRLLTFTGPGGVGKTRLALALMKDIAGEYPDGATFVSLAALNNSDLVPASIATALGITPANERPVIESVLRHVAGRRLLLVLDNFEQVAAAADTVRAILSSGPAVTVLVTSRVRLHISGEQSLPVPPLQTPEPTDYLDISQLAQIPAVRLFVERARAVNPAFALSDTNAGAVRDICCRLDGLPLAIELAATRIQVLDPHAIGERLDRALPLLTGGPRDAPERQQTIRATIAWSYGLLDADQQRLLCQLSVFSGGWTLEAAEAVCSPDLMVLDGLGGLLDHSLVRHTLGDVNIPRFEMLGTIRQFVGEHWLAESEVNDIRDRHASFFLAWSEKMGRDLYWGDADEAKARLLPEMTNIHDAFSWAIERDPTNVEILDQALRCSFRVALFWKDFGQTHEGRRLIDAALSKPGASDAARMEALNGLATLASEQGDYQKAIVLFEECLAIAMDESNVQQEIWALWGLGRTLMWEQKLERAMTVFTQAYDVADRHGYIEMKLLPWAFIGLTTAFGGDPDRGAEILEEVRAVGDAAGLARVEPLALVYSATIEMLRGNSSRARDLASRGLELEITYGPTRLVMNALYVLAQAAAADRQPERAALLLSASESMLETIGSPWAPLHRQQRDQLIRDSQMLTTADQWENAWSSGRSMSLDEVIDCALEPEDAAPADASRAKGPGITERELDVLRLLVEGRSNQEIAGVLFISPHTAARHIANIMNKLGVDSRTAAATWAVRHGINGPHPPSN
jgi:predicted ATPase/DNA-binding CsgD family transcriptional regulator